MKWIFIIGCCLGWMAAYSQNALGAQDNLEALTKKWENHERQLRLYDQKLLLVSAQNKQHIDALKKDFNKNLQLQAQNEAAVNNALDGFTEQLESQNKTMQGVQETLQKQWNQQLLRFAGLFFAFIIALYLGIRFSTKKALKQANHNWNQLHAYILSGAYKQKQS